jgi:hypothetical protein
MIYHQCIYVCMYICMLSVMQCYFTCLNFFGLVLIVLFKCIFMTLKFHRFSLKKTTPRIDLHL